MASRTALGFGDGLRGLLRQAHLHPHQQHHRCVGCGPPKAPVATRLPSGGWARRACAPSAVPLLARTLRSALLLAATDVCADVRVAHRSLASRASSLLGPSQWAAREALVLAFAADGHARTRARAARACCTCLRWLIAGAGTRQPVRDTREQSGHLCRVVKGRSRLLHTSTCERAARHAHALRGSWAARARPRSKIVSLYILRRSQLRLRGRVISHPVIRRARSNALAARSRLSQPAPAASSRCWLPLRRSGAWPSRAPSCA